MPCCGIPRALNEMSTLPAFLRTSGDVSFYRFLVEGIDHGSLGSASAIADVARDRRDGRRPPPGQEERGALSREGAGHRAANGAASAVDDGSLVLEQHVSILRVPCRRPKPRLFARLRSHPQDAGSSAKDSECLFQMRRILPPSGNVSRMPTNGVAAKGAIR